MSKSAPINDEAIYREYILDVRIVEHSSPDGTVYRFEAPHHGGIEFDDPEKAKLYADIYFDVNGFDEDNVGEEGVPPTIIQAGRDTLAAYFHTQPYGSINWIASFYGFKPERAQRLINRVRKRATKIRDGATERGIA